MPDTSNGSRADLDGHRTLICIVEDNHFVRAGWEARLSQENDIRVIGSFADFETAFSSGKFEEADLALVDLKLPGASGIEGIKLLKNLFPTVRAIVCTMYDDDQMLFGALCAGADGYLVKHANLEELVKAIRDTVAGGSPMSPNIVRKVISVFQRPMRQTHSPAVFMTDRERSVLEKIAVGKPYSTIARELFISIDGVRYHIKNIYEKLHVHSRSRAVAEGIKTGIIAPPLY